MRVVPCADRVLILVTNLASDWILVLRAGRRAGRVPEQHEQRTIPEVAQQPKGTPLVCV